MEMLDRGVIRAQGCTQMSKFGCLIPPAEANLSQSALRCFFDRYLKILTKFVLRMEKRSEVSKKMILN